MKKHTGTSRALRRDRLYCYDTTLQREETAGFLMDYAAKNKENICAYWDKLRRYYDGDHDIRQSIGEFAHTVNLPWLAAQSTDGFIHVETQLQPSVPAFEFSPRDRTDYDKAKQREGIVRYICDNNELELKNSSNERSLNIYGTAAFKVCWDPTLRFGCDEGDVSVQTCDIRRLITDPCASDLDGCEYMGYVYPMHSVKAQRVFKDDFISRGEDFEDYLENRDFYLIPEKLSSGEFDVSDDTVTVTEWYFRQPKDGHCVITRMHNGIKRSFPYEWKAGDIALCVFINGKEVRYVPKYWQNTGFSGYPFVVYTKLPKENSLWGKSELEEIIPLIDAKDRELAFAQLNSAFASNDIILAEENALCDGETLDNSPGSVWKLRPGMMGKVMRLGNNASAQSGLYANSAYWQNLIENTTGNFEVSQGKEPSNVTTATGIALLNERSESRKKLKNSGRTAGFKRLYLLIDMTALENYNDGRVIRMGFGEEEGFVFRYGGFIKRTREERYIPSLDVTVHLGNDIGNSKAFTVSALSTLMNMSITRDNYVLVKAYVRTIAIPESEKICQYLDERFAGEEKVCEEPISMSDIKELKVI